MPPRLTHLTDGIDLLTQGVAIGYEHSESKIAFQVSHAMISE